MQPMNLITQIRTHNEAFMNAYLEHIVVKRLTFMGLIADLNIVDVQRAIVIIS